MPKRNNLIWGKLLILLVLLPPAFSVLKPRASNPATGRDSSLLSYPQRDGGSSRSKSVRHKPITSSDVRGGSSAHPFRTSEIMLQSTGLVFILSVASVMITPTSHLITELGAGRATKILANVAAMSAACEIVATPIIGSLADSAGRKPVLLATTIMVAVAHAGVSLHPTTSALAGAKFLGSIVIGLYFLAAQAMLADIHQGQKERLAAASGILSAVVSAGFGGGIQLGVLFAGRPNGLRWNFGVSAILSAVAATTLAVSVRETIPSDAKIDFSPASAASKLVAPFSFIRLLRQGRRLRLLTILMAGLYFPLFMGDYLQIFMTNEKGVSEAAFAQLFSVMAVSGVLANLGAGPIVAKLGVLRFWSVSMISSLVVWVGLTLSFRSGMACAVVGFLGAARFLTPTVMHTEEGFARGISQGQLSGDRANLIAVIKVLAPLLYGKLYLTGKEVIGMPQLPLYFNVLLTVVSLLLGSFVLMSNGSS